MTPPPPDSLGFLLTDATRAIRRRFEQRAACLGLSSSQWRLLMQLKRGGPLPQARLAELLEIEPISVSRLVDRMQEAGWVRREPDATDRRVKLVAPTEKAMQTVSAARAVAEALYDEALAGLPPEHRDLLKQALQQIIRNLSTASETEHDR
ncbi:MarR family winged helix-turn-helix transcriptional regulator [Paenirhodobacter sp.]|jgi:DNA-binding MarR family transcriptional regulator|uniref:MarR family winged helix-turn-helix transcriptional regulator n=1 Tax=Paenirhodobacter sp. TaxID=1965326 RepID=UPI003B5023A1